MGATPRELPGIVKAYPEFVHRRLFTRLKIKDSGFDETRRLPPHRASGYNLAVIETAPHTDAAEFQALSPLLAHPVSPLDSANPPHN